jgi:hypothetical protein
MSSVREDPAPCGLKYGNFRQGAQAKFPESLGTRHGN